jgi:broad specificity phosphatase PhoE
MPVVYLIRHGQASFGAEDYDVLSPVGHQQSKLLASALLRRGVARPDRIVAGSLKRQRATASTCSAAAGYDLPIDTDPGWDEYDHVALLSGHEDVGTDHRAVQQTLDAGLLAWIRSGAPDPSGRSFDAWRDGALAAQQELMDSLGRGGIGLAFTSGGVLAAICAQLLGLDAEGLVALNRVTVNTGITKIVSGRAGTSLLSFNDHGHLEGAAELLTYR